MLHVAPKKNVATLQSTNQIAGLQMSLFSDGHVSRLMWKNILQGFDLVEEGIGDLENVHRSVLNYQLKTCKFRSFL